MNPDGNIARHSILLFVKYPLAILLVLSFFWPAPVARAEHEPWEIDFNRTDSQAHMLGAYGFALTETLLLEKVKVKRWKAVAIATVTTLALGLGKELIIDKHLSKSDMLATGLGTGVSAMVVLVFSL